MKKYKLIKMYPGVDIKYISVGDTFTEQGNGSYIQEEKKQFCRYCVLQREVENYPEFWEEVKEKEWEIIELKKVDGSDHSNEKRKIEIYLKTLEHGPNLYWFIHSIKRLSDGEMFTVGDTIYCPNILQFNEATIVSFELRGKSILVKSNWHVIGIDLRNAKKIEKKAPLFKTEDGVHLYEGDNYWTVFTKASSEIKAFTLYGPHKLKRLDTEIEEESFDFANCKYFAQINSAVKFIEESQPKVMYGVNESFTKTAESADKVDRAFPAGNWKWFNSEKERDLYVEENKPRFSKKDMLSFGKYVGSRMTFTDPLKIFSDWNRDIRKEK